MLMALSRLTSPYWWLLPAVAGGGFLGVRLWLGTAAGKRALDTSPAACRRSAPSPGTWPRPGSPGCWASCCRARCPLLEALNLTRDSVANHHYVALITAAGQAVTRGEPLASAFRDTGLVSPQVYEAMRSGDKSGQMGQLLWTIADFLDEENEVTLRSLTSILEPMILIVLGVLVGFVAISMFMPLFDLTAATRGG